MDLKQLATALKQIQQHKDGEIFLHTTTIQDGKVIKVEEAIIPLEDEDDEKK